MTFNGSLKVSAPGKLILFGEHSVVYGKKALACAVDRRITICTKVLEDDNLILQFSDLWKNELNINISEILNQKDTLPKFCNDVCKSMDDKLSCVAVMSLLSGYLAVFKACQPSLHISVKSDLPLGAGLGSSAAFNTALACTFLIINGDILHSEINNGILNEPNLKMINSLAYDMEKIVHNTPSGIDNSVSVYGNAISFQDGKIISLAIPVLSLLIVNTNIARNTKNLVNGVREKHNIFPKLFNEIFSSLDILCAEVQELFNKTNTGEYNEIDMLNKMEILINTNQGLLSAIGVSHEKIDTITSLCKKHNFACKLTGAGGGGCCFVLIHPRNVDRVKKLKIDLENNNFNHFETTLGCAGVKVDEMTIK